MNDIVPGTVFLIDGQDVAAMTPAEKDAKLVDLARENDELRYAVRGTSVGMMRLRALYAPRGAKKPVPDEGGL